MSGQPVLTPEDHEHFIEHGYVVVKNAVPRETYEAAVTALEAGKDEGRPGTPAYKPAATGDLIKACQTDRMFEAINSDCRVASWHTGIDHHIRHFIKALPARMT